MKFFLFSISNVSLASTRNSDSGIGISAIAIPANKLSNITATKGFVNMTFDDAGVYDESFMNVGEAIEKVNISIAAAQSRGVNLIEDILNFISSEGRQSVMRFDAVNNVSDMRFSDVSSSSNLIAKVSTAPISMETGRLSVGTTEEEFQDTIAGINFRGNLPSLDFNHEGLSTFADGDEITSWANAGTGGTTYSIASNVGTPRCETSSATSNLSKTSADIGVGLVGAHFIIPNAFTVADDYTIYCVLGQTVPPMCLYGDAAGQTVGFGGSYPAGTDLTLNSVVDRRNSFSVRHSGIDGAVASVQTNNEDNGTLSYTWPKAQIASQVAADYDADVFVIRRDKDFNMILHNRDGDIIAFIPAKTKAQDEKLTKDSPSRTDGNLLIERLGTVKDIVSIAGGRGFRSFVARFGVIPQDIGVSKARILAEDLFKFYKS